ncbi:hypothetical protein KRR38_27550 [Novosphingobium sp. G106]|uniref:hypothetical protein n=1 Tax=Novosphingobium sp. G106 TaxID=2849500 RepID=UPI001C2D03AA|nr:hypothetical protein [Novosphingobium sp. G106]MBV1691339.1 hypothetical protein [Novosphingobium sp. G106]
MIEKRNAEDLGFTDFNGAQAAHHFCFGPYQSLDRVNWGALRMLNTISLKPGGAREPYFLGAMEVVIFVEEGRLDIICADRRVTLGRGEFAVLAMRTGGDFGFRNCGDQTAELIEIWFNRTDDLGMPTLRRGRVTDQIVLAGHDGHGQADRWLSGETGVTRLENRAAEPISWTIVSGRPVYVLVLEGHAEIRDILLDHNDAAALRLENSTDLLIEKPGKYLILEC